FGSSVTGKVYAVAVDTGQSKWSFYADGPVRFAPTVADGKVYFGSDDGYVYCLDAADGRLIWKYRAGPSDERVIGNGHMISLWPVRTSIIVDRGQVLFCAGVFPYEGLYVCALDPDDGSVIWKNDTIGDRAHELDFGGISPHGYLAASKDIVYVPSGRALPAAFSRATGKFLFFAKVQGKGGGVWTLLAGDELIAGTEYSGRPDKFVYNAVTGAKASDVLGRFPAIDIAIKGNLAYVVTEYGVSEVVRTNANLRRTAIHNSEPANLPAKLKGKSVRRHFPAKGLATLAIAGDTLFAGGDGLVLGIDLGKGREMWRYECSGKVSGLAVAAGRLLASTDTGVIYCFSANGSGAGRRMVERPQTWTGTAGSESQQIIAATGVSKGWGLVLGCEDGDLAASLAKASDLNIVALVADPEKCRKAREQLDAYGILGSRVAIEPWTIDQMPACFANLIVSRQSGASARDGDKPDAAVYRVLRPYGGVAVSIGRNRLAKYVRGQLEGAGKWTQQYGNPSNTACSGDERVRGSLGIQWFGGPGPVGMVERHSRSQSPVAIDGRMFVEGSERILAIDSFNGTTLWERYIPGAIRTWTAVDSGNLVATKAGLYVAAYDKCYLLDPATGATIRVYNLPPSRDGGRRRWGYISVDNGILYGSASAPMALKYGAVVDALVSNGKWVDEKDVPIAYLDVYRKAKAKYPEPNEDFIRETQRNGLMYKSMTTRPRSGEFLQKSAVSDAMFTSDSVFAMDTDTGKVLWKHDGQRMANTTFVIGDGTVFFTDCAVSMEEKREALDEMERLSASGKYFRQQGVTDELSLWQKRLKEHANDKNAKYMVQSLKAELLRSKYPEGSLTIDDLDVRRVTALDAVTGRKLWETVMDFTGCCGDAMGAAYKDGLLLFFGNYGNHDAWRAQIGGLRWRRVTVLSGKTGELVWSRPMNYRTRPLIVKDKLIIEPRVCDIRTGQMVMRKHPITGKDVPLEFLRPGHTCGITCASSSTLFYRSSCAALYDLDDDRGVTLFGGYRPGCAISIIPADGLVLSPEASSGCTCSYPVRGSLAMIPKPHRAEPWTVFVTSGQMTPVTHFAINLGAPADMKDDDTGMLWFGYPNPRTVYFKNHYPGYGVKFDLHEQLAPNATFFCRDFKDVQIPGTDKPWLFTSGCEGLLQCRIPVRAPSDQSAPDRYTVRLGFMAPQSDRAGQRVFDVKVQGSVRLNNFDITQEADGPAIAIVREINHVKADDTIEIDMVPESQAKPVVNFIEIIAES
ncbi:MAG: PQQ-binding-like beta-propeller repeat protein, partial [Candidatus Hydrogenedentes bacterium]|nr:PQQ-binding-like beta-propeller repeat protein [Candidatus Hydrogenedentota bacterium]